MKTTFEKISEGTGTKRGGEIEKEDFLLFGLITIAIFSILFTPEMYSLIVILPIIGMFLFLILKAALDLNKKK